MNNQQEVIKKLYNIWFDAKSKLNEFEITFPKDKYIEEIREEFLPDFFDNVNELYWYYFLISISKLLEPHKQWKKTNLTLFSLPEILKENEIPQWKAINDEVEQLKITNQPIIDYRNKYLAHFDFDFSTGKRKLDATTSIEEVKEFFDQMYQLINQTLTLLSLPIKSDVIINHGKFKGANKLNQILIEYRKINNLNKI